MRNNTVGTTEIKPVETEVAKSGKQESCEYYHGNVQVNFKLDAGEDVVRIVNPRQVYFYLQNGLHPIRLEAGYNDRIVYIFEKKDSLVLFHEWREKCKLVAGESR